MWMIAFLVLAMSLAKVQIRLIHPHYPTTEDDAMTAAANAFNAIHPECNVTVEYVPWGSLFRTIIAANERKSGPDIIAVGSTWASDLIERGIVRSLQAYYNAWRGEREGGDVSLDFARNVEFDYVFDRQWHIHPLDVGARVFFYRKDLYRDVLGSDEPPQTYEEVLQNSLLIQEHQRALGHEHWGFGVSGSLEAAQTLQMLHPFVQSWGSSVLNADNKCNFESTAFRDAVGNYTALYMDEERRVNPYKNASDLMLAELFRAGNLTHMIGGSYLATLMADVWWADPSDLYHSIGVTRMPKGPRGRFSFLGGSGFGIATWSEAPDLAWEFMKFAFDPESPYFEHILVGEHGTLVPAYKSLLRLIPESSLPLQAVVENLPFAVPQQYPSLAFPQMARIEANGTISRIIYNVQVNGMTVERATQIACVEFEEIMLSALCEGECLFGPCLAECPAFAVLPQADCSDSSQCSEGECVDGTCVITTAESNVIALMAIGVSLCVFLLGACFLTIMLSRDRDMHQHNSFEVDPDDVDIGDEIGRGTYGAVHVGSWRSTRVAVKIMHCSDITKAARASFINEVNVMGSLRHPNVVLFMGASTFPPHLLIVCEFMELGSVYGLLKNTGLALTWQQRMSMAHGCASGMSFLHSATPPIIHRDLKSLNLLVSANWVTKVSDFGLSMLKPGMDSGSDEMVGSLLWTAPEVLRRNAECFTTPCDVYSFGITLWEILTRKLPFESMNPFAAAHLVTSKGLRPPIDKQWPPGIQTILEECFKDDASARPCFRDIEPLLADELTTERDISLDKGHTEVTFSDSTTVVCVNIRDAVPMWLSAPRPMYQSMTILFQCVSDLLQAYSGTLAEKLPNGLIAHFLTSVQAANFSTVLQFALMEREWPCELDNIPFMCRADNLGPDNVKRTMYHGLRVRVAISKSCSSGTPIALARELLELVPVGRIFMCQETKEDVDVQALMVPCVVYSMGSRPGADVYELVPRELEARASVPQVLPAAELLAGRLDLDSKQVVPVERCGITDVHMGKYKGQDVVIKKFDRARVQLDSLSFHLEISKLRELEHPNVVMVVGVVTTPYVAIVEERLGRTLKAALAANLPSVEEKRKACLMDVCAGMVFLHGGTYPVVHGDIKPSNILERSDGTWAVADYGFSEIKSLMRTLSTCSVDCLQYLAPEVLQGDPPDRGSDVYSYGVLGWCITSRQAINNPVALLQDPVPSRAQTPKRGRRWLPLLQLCWSPEPSQRISFADLFDQLAVI